MPIDVQTTSPGAPLVLEEDADAFAPVDAADRLGEERSDRDYGHLFRELDRLRLDRVSDDQTLDRAALEPLHRSLREDTARDSSGHRTGAARDELLGDLGQRAGADREVVDDDRVTIGDLADDLHELSGLAVAFAHLVG